MTKQEAIKAMRAGEKVAHRNFTPDEWMKYNDTGRIEFEDGCLCFPYEFWECRSGQEWEEGWRIAS